MRRWEVCRGFAFIGLPDDDVFGLGLHVSRLAVEVHFATTARAEAVYPDVVVVRIDGLLDVADQGSVVARRDLAFENAELNMLDEALEALEESAAAAVVGHIVAHDKVHHLDLRGQGSRFRGAGSSVGSTLSQDEWLPTKLAGLEIAGQGLCLPVEDL